jgi:hypothetical protein
MRADAQRVQHTGRWLVRHSTDRCSALVGLALLATGRAPEEMPLIQTVGLLSDNFGALAAHASRPGSSRRRHRGAAVAGRPGGRLGPRLRPQRSV